MSRGFRRLLITAITFGLLTGQCVEAQTSWTRVFDNYYTSSIETTPWGILAGEVDTRIWLYPYNGIYISQDLGETWKEFSLKDKGITHIKYSDNILYATTYYHTDTPAGLYKSSDMGKTWEHIGPPYSVSYLDVDATTIYLGTTAHGLFVSTDSGETWTQKIPVGDIQIIKVSEDKVITSTVNKTYQSSDNGNTWEEIDYIRLYPEEKYKKYVYTLDETDIYENTAPTNLQLKSQDISVTHTKPPYLFSSINDYGIYRYEIPQYTIKTNPFLDIPWEYTNENELIDKITAYFDHEYPLMNNEPLEYQNTTVNYLGMKEKPPRLYYSSHNGTDYALPYGTSILAPYNGVATYYWCNSCGNTIEIDHQNGYKTTYMHLQDDISIPKDQVTPVNKGESIGKVGLTGRTTGPHLHFEVANTRITDPYGWQTDEYEDPWDSNAYLWNIPPEQTTYLVNNLNNQLQHDNKEIRFINTPELINYTIDIKNYIRPTIANTLKYIEHTSVLIGAYNLLGQKVEQLLNPVELSFDLTNVDLTNILSTTLKIYYFDETLMQWEPVETILDIQNNIVKGYTNHFSHFAVFGEIDYSNHLFKGKGLVKNSVFTISL